MADNYFYKSVGVAQPLMLNNEEEISYSVDEAEYEEDPIEDEEE